MIVDLLRNDLSRIAKPFSVKVPTLCGLETYANVHHLVSVVEAQLDETFDAVDLIKATFPGGSITGAPKIKAMEIIGEIDEDGSGELEFPEFIQLAAKFLIEEDEEQMKWELREAFRLYDKHGKLR